MATIDTDILIIGGGIAGCIAAIALTTTHRVVVIDKRALLTDRIGESLAPAAGRILQELCLLEEMEHQVGVLYQQNLGMQSYWGSDQVHWVDHLRNPDGFVKSLNRKAFEGFLRESAEARGARCLWGAKLYDSAKEGTRWQVQAGNGNERITINSAFVLDASGRQAHFARNLGLKRVIKDKLVACWLTLPNTHTNTMSTITASENGWWYSAVVPNNQRVVAFHTDSDLLPKQALKTTAALLELAQENRIIHALLDRRAEEITFRGTVAANSTKLQHVAGPSWAALGDAAVSFDPLSSQGMFNAMASAMQVSTLIQQLGFTAALTEAYTQQIDQIWQYYLKHKRVFYGVEKRWTTSEFWRRRQELRR